VLHLMPQQALLASNGDSSKNGHLLLMDRPVISDEFSGGGGVDANSAAAPCVLALRAMSEAKIRAVRQYGVNGADPDEVFDPDDADHAQLLGKMVELVFHRRSTGGRNVVETRRGKVVLLHQQYGAVVLVLEEWRPRGERKLLRITAAAAVENLLDAHELEQEEDADDAEAVAMDVEAEVEEEGEEEEASFLKSVIVLDVMLDKKFTGGKRNCTGMPKLWFDRMKAKTVQPLDDSLDPWREGAVVIRQTLGWSSYLTRGRAALALTPHFSLLRHQMTAKVRTAVRAMPDPGNDVVVLTAQDFVGPCAIDLNADEIVADAEGFPPKDPRASRGQSTFHSLTHSGRRREPTPYGILKPMITEGMMSPRVRDKWVGKAMKALYAVTKEKFDSDELFSNVTRQQLFSDVLADHLGVSAPIGFEAITIAVMRDPREPLVQHVDTRESIQALASAALRTLSSHVCCLSRRSER
jgi:hypothetical protein